VKEHNNNVPVDDVDIVVVVTFVSADFVINESAGNKQTKQTHQKNSITRVRFYAD